MRDKCVTVDEFAHVPAGVSQWERGSFALYRENPPLVRSIVALPVWLAIPRTDYSRERVGPGARTEWEVGQDFSYSNPESYQSLIRGARWVVVVFSLACGALILRWSRELFGRPASFVCAFPWLFDPNVLAHSGVATLDVGASFMGFAATYCFWRFPRRPRWASIVLPGVALGLAQASRFSMLALYPSWIAMAVAWMTFHGSPTGSYGSRTIHTLQVLGVFLLSFATLNSCYLFEGTGTALGNLPLQSKAFQALTSLGGPAINGQRLAQTLPADRHSRPTPFAFLAVGQIIKEAWSSRVGRPFVVACLAFNAEEVGRFRSQYLSYTNQLAGGYEHVCKYLMGSNYDWGQDPVRLQRWIDAHTQQGPIVVSCYGAIDPRMVGLPLCSLPEGPPSFRADAETRFRPDYLAVSSNLIHGLPLPLRRRGGFLTDDDGEAVDGSRALGSPRPVDIDLPLGGAGAPACGATGGLNSRSANHACATTGCLTTSATCARVGSQCLKIATGSPPSTYPCTTGVYSGNCCAKTQSHCIPESSGTPSYSYSFRGEALYVQYPRRT